MIKKPFFGLGKLKLKYSGIKDLEGKDVLPQRVWQKKRLLALFPKIEISQAESLILQKGKQAKAKACLLTSSLSNLSN